MEYYQLLELKQEILVDLELTVEQKAAIEYFKDLKKSGNLTETQSTQLDNLLKMYKGDAPLFRADGSITAAGRTKEATAIHLGELRGGQGIKNLANVIDPQEKGLSLLFNDNDFGLKMLDNIDNIELKNLNKRIDRYNATAAKSPKSMIQIPKAKVIGSGTTKKIMVDAPQFRAIPSNPSAYNFPQYNAAIKKDANQYLLKGAGLYGGAGLATYGAGRGLYNMIDSLGPTPEEAEAMTIQSMRNRGVRMGMPGAETFDPYNDNEYQSFRRYEDSLFNPNFDPNLDTIYDYKVGGVYNNNNMKKYRYGGHYGLPQYGDGGLFKSIFGKKFKDTGFGKGVRDLWCRYCYYGGCSIRGYAWNRLWYR